LSRLLRRLRVSKDSLKDEAWHIRAAWRITAWRERAEQLRIENPDEYQRILGLATDEEQRLAEQDPDGFVGLRPRRSQEPSAA
jgi:hypothetical protein